MYTNMPRLSRVRISALGAPGQPDPPAEPSVLVCSTFSPSVEADFVLRVRSDAALTVTAQPSEGAGMFTRQLRLDLCDAVAAMSPDTTVARTKPHAWSLRRTSRRSG